MLVTLPQVPATINGNYFTGLLHVVVMYCSIAKSGRLLCIAGLVRGSLASRC